ncbi:hypothetical protein DBV15_05975 [Temnothorax longispinosus]|uniref:Uncharacterized protein n=1 Tax=Temnothorax longispinosus TaxID=300112 RepID=A0A4S2KHU6_9HYME|nr:hypothetical protein DBV15_05975 [Temnothorax longispinosus]
MCRGSHYHAHLTSEKSYTPVGVARRPGRPSARSGARSGTTLLGVCRQIRSWGSVKILWDTLYGWSMHVGSAYLTALRARAYSAAQLSAKETGWQKEKKVIVGRHLNPAAGCLSPHCWTVSPWGEGPLRSRTVGHSASA